MIKNRLLILSTEVSGINKYLFEALEKSGWKLIVEDIPLPSLCRPLALALSFNFKMSTWKKRYESNYMKICKTGWVFKVRTRDAMKKIRKHKGNYDLIFQISSLFASSLKLFLPTTIGESQGRKYVLWIDYTTSLSKNYPGWAPYKHELKKRLFWERIIYTNAQFIFTTSENTRRSMIEHYGVSPEKVKAVGNGLNLKEVKTFEKKYDGKTILFIGMDFERKGGFVLLEAFQKVKKEIPSASLIIIGPNKDIHKIEGPGIEFLGNVSDRKAIENYYQEASLFVMPSLCEPFGLVFLEAMAYKLPCIGTDTDAMPEIIQNGKNGFLVPVGDSQALADKIISLLKNDLYLKQLGENAYQFVKENFLWEKVVDRIEESLKNII